MVGGVETTSVRGALTRGPRGYSDVSVATGEGPFFPSLALLCAALPVLFPFDNAARMQSVDMRYYATLHSECDEQGSFLLIGTDWRLLKKS